MVTDCTEWAVCGWSVTPGGSDGAGYPVVPTRGGLLTIAGRYRRRRIGPAVAVGIGEQSVQALRDSRAFGRSFP